MAATDDLIRDSARYLANTYARFPVVLVRGRGDRLWDSDGKEYLDFAAGIAVDVLGHCHPKVVEAIKAQAEALLHVSNLYHIEPQIRLAQALCEHSFADKVFFCNSGAEANEAAIKLARRYAKVRWGPDRYEIVCMRDSFHGRTMATLTATGQEKHQRGFEPLLPGFKHIPFNDLRAAEQAIDSRTCAVLVEPIQGEGGVRVPDDDYLPALRQLCSDRDVLLMLDEVQTGMGRTGRLFAYEHWGIEPDVMTLAKALGGGLPIGAMLAKEEVASAFVPGSHASTFGGSPFITAAALAALTAIIEERLPQRAAKIGAYFLGRLRELVQRYPYAKEARGKGLILALELAVPAKPIVDRCLQLGLLILTAGDQILRFVPPLIIGEAEVDEALSILDQALAEQPR
ncbi:MAG: argD [candidate division NC10 bacterium]|jgi:predicted acetylornithine/succinylornithine family transaminase|nr:argD [candidate division NC10 bacterium]MBF8278898.1 argD [candidate division NC10 bacterium]MBF8298512.1 argD [candidate division NC10 bacterium]